MGTYGGFGGSIPVLALNLGFPGTPSRGDDRYVHSRQVNINTANPLLFGQGAVIIPDSTGGTVQSIADFIAAGGNFQPSSFAGVAVRNVKTNLTYGTLGNIGSANPYIGSFAQGQIAGIFERGSITVTINNGTPITQNPVFVRTALNGAIPAGVVGGFEAVADGTIAAVLTGTGNGTATQLAIGAAAEDEVYTVTFTSGTAYKVTDAAGNVLGYGSIVATTGKTSYFSSKYVSFLLTQGSVVFVTSDSFAITVSALKTVGLSDVVFTTGVIDGNNTAEITLKNRVAA
jgi:hypothetical protein